MVVKVTDLYTVRCHCNMVNFIKDIHKRYLIAPQLALGMVCLLWIQHQIDILPQILQWCVQYLVILDRVLTVLDCMYPHASMCLNHGSSHVNQLHVLWSWWSLKHHLLPVAWINLWMAMWPITRLNGFYLDEAGFLRIDIIVEIWKECYCRLFSITDLFGEADDWMASPHRMWVMWHFGVFFVL